MAYGVCNNNTIDGTLTQCIHRPTNRQQAATLIYCCLTWLGARHHDVYLLLLLLFIVWEIEHTHIFCFYFLCVFFSGFAGIDFWHPTPKRTAHTNTRAEFSTSGTYLDDGVTAARIRIHDLLFWYRTRENTQFDCNVEHLLSGDSIIGQSERKTKATRGGEGNVRRVNHLSTATTTNNNGS